MQQGKLYGACKRLNVQFVFSSNGHLFVEYDRFSGLTSKLRPLSEIPTPDDLRARYERGMGFRLDSEGAKPLLVPYQPVIRRKALGFRFDESKGHGLSVRVDTHAERVIDPPSRSLTRYTVYDVDGTRSLFAPNQLFGPSACVESGIDKFGTGVRF